jgi:hypothetical protein
VIAADPDATGGALRGAAAAPWWRFALGGLVAAALAAAANLGWRAAFSSVTGHPLPAAIDPPSVVLASALPVLLGAGIYLLLARSFAIATPLYAAGSLAVAVASCVAAFTPVLPDGTPAPPEFPTLVIPMHLIAGVIAAAVAPVIVVIGTRTRS